MVVGGLVGIAVFAVAFVVDLLTKSYAVGHAGHGVAVIYNARPNDLPIRIVMCLVAIAVAVALTRLAAWRGLGRIWGAWVGIGLLVAGILGNGISTLIWVRGVPDFIDMGSEMWNLADFMIGLGLTGGLFSVAVGALLVFVRERVAAPSSS
jgi:hypothetical protein